MILYTSWEQVGTCWIERVARRLDGWLTLALTTFTHWLRRILGIVQLQSFLLGRNSVILIIAEPESPIPVQQTEQRVRQFTSLLPAELVLHFGCAKMITAQWSTWYDCYLDEKKSVEKMSFFFFFPRRQNILLQMFSVIYHLQNYYITYIGGWFYEFFKYI